MFNQLQEFYYKVEMPKIRQKISDFKVELGSQGKCRRLSYLYDRLIEFDRELIERQSAYEQSVREDNPYIERQLIASYIPGAEKEIKKIESEIRFIVHPPKGNKITPEMIERAREYPIENLIDVKRGLSRCIFHDDRHPSMGIKNNRFHCFSCGAKGDVIKFMMKKNEFCFTESVKFLNSLSG